MGTLSDASDLDFRVQPRKETTDSPKGPERRETEDADSTKEETPIPETRSLGPEVERNTGREERALTVPKNPRTNATEPSHDPGGSWLHKVRSFIGLSEIKHSKGKQGRETGHEGKAGKGSGEKGHGVHTKNTVTITKEE
ncbi:hypothetical protein NDU88_004355 [Pleurodeles waltl]|uniref:Myelin basic protein n=1 Tax=Pleurodeles waltl TaxID=8319 RepID=A0AAV7SIJ5_PLEWA|nr:hypothetical protein NDU88_004355 [Pleurodeles waltl]